MINSSNSKVELTLPPVELEEFDLAPSSRNSEDNKFGRSK